MLDHDRPLENRADADGHAVDDSVEPTADLVVGGRHDRREGDQFGSAAHKTDTSKLHRPEFARAGTAGWEHETSQFYQIRHEWPFVWV